MTLTELKNIAYINGYTVHNYSSVFAKVYFTILGITLDAAKTQAGFTVMESEGDILIFIDDTKPQNTQLFALAHEIGHIILKHRDKMLSVERQEKEANLFANAILSKGSVKIWNY